MKKLLTISLFIFTVFISQSAFSQSNKLSFALYGGLSIPSSDLKGDVNFNILNNPSGTVYNYSQKSGFNVGGALKYVLDRTGNLQVVGSLNYNGFSNTADTTEGSTGSENAKIKVNILSANVGVQYNFMPNQKVNPYVNLDFTNNFISGSTVVTTNGNTPPSTDKSLKSAWRGGLQFGAGLDFALSPSIGVLVGANYNLANLIGKDTVSSTATTEYALNDKEYSIAGGTVAAKNISYIQLYAGISIYMNRVIRK